MVLVARPVGTRSPDPYDWTRGEGRRIPAPVTGQVAAGRAVIAGQHVLKSTGTYISICCVLEADEDKAGRESDILALLLARVEVSRVLEDQGGKSTSVCIGAKAVTLSSERVFPVAHITGSLPDAPDWTRGQGRRIPAPVTGQVAAGRAVNAGHCPFESADTLISMCFVLDADEDAAGCECSICACHLASIELGLVLKNQGGKSTSVCVGAKAITLPDEPILIRMPCFAQRPYITATLSTTV